MKIEYKNLLAVLKHFSNSQQGTSDGALVQNQPFNCQSRKMVKHIQTIRWQIADELFEFV